MQNNELAIRQESTPAISIETEELIKAGESANTLRAYRRALLELDKWLDAAIKWQAKNMN